MKPNFALDLSHEGINLLHRSKGGWTLVGAVALDDPEMGAHLHQLRRSAAMLESGGITTKLIIPDSQILYTTVDAPGPDDISREVQIRAALDGLTPYPVGQLVFDWRADGDQARVAVLARETMDEAEGFAAQYKFNPVSFAARPARGAFSGEPFFGKSRAAAQILAPGERVEPDASPVPRKPRGTPEAPESEAELVDGDAPGLAEADAAPEPLAQTLPEASAPPAPDPDDPFSELDQLAAELSGDAPPAPPKPATKPRRKRGDGGRRIEAPVLAPFPPTPDERDDGPVSAPRAFIPKPEKPAKPALAPKQTSPGAAVPDRGDDAPGDGAAAEAPLKPHTDDAAPPISFASSRTAPAPDASPPADGSASDRLAGVAPRIGMADKADPGSTTAPAPTTATGSSKPDGPRAEPQRAPMVPHDRIRADMAEALAKPLPRGGNTVDEEEEAPSPGALGRFAGAARGLAGKAGAAAAVQREKRAARKAEAAEASLANTTPERSEPEAADDKPRKSLLGPRRERSDTDRQRERERAREAEAMTVFGARKTQATPSRPKYLGLIMTLLLLLAMAAVAIWSSFLVDDGESSLFNPSPEVVTERPVAPSTQEAQGGTEAPEPEPPQAPDTAEVLSPEAAQARYAATGIWQRAPEAPAEPETTRLELLDLGEIPGAIAARDATPLPAPTTGAVPDAALADPVPPPPPGTTFNLDANGLVVPTPDGALSPTGILVFSGRPAAVPPAPPAGMFPEPTVEAAPDAAAEAALAAAVEAAAAETATPQTTTPFALPGVPRIRPQPRPSIIPPAPVEAPAEVPAETPAETPTDPAATDDNAALVRPNARPAAIADTAAINAAVTDVIDAAFADATELAVDASIKPSARPRNFDKLIAAAQTSASDGSQVIAAAAATVAPAIPTTASVAARATTENALNLRQVNLIGIYGSSSARRALVRLSNGRYVKVEIGDRLDGGKVTSISGSKLTYQKGRRAYTLEVLPLG